MSRKAASPASANWKSSVTPRNVVIHRSNSTQPGVRGVQKSLANQMYSAPDSGMDPSCYKAVGQTGVMNVKDCAAKEKKDMQDLNGRFSSYIENVRFLEAQNRKLVNELDKLKQTWGKETNTVKKMYDGEMNELRKLLDDSEKQKAEQQIRMDSLNQELGETSQILDEAKEDVDRQKNLNEVHCRDIVNLEANVKNLQQTIEGLENDQQQSKNELARVVDALKRARTDLDAETLAHIEAENKNQTLEEEIEFLKTIHEEELKELGSLAYKDNTPENREFWKNEMAQAMRELQNSYDEKLEEMRAELESNYGVKVMEFKTASIRHGLEATHAKEETKRMRDLMADLRGKLTDLESKNAKKDKEIELLKQELHDRERDLEHENAQLRNEIAKLRAELEAIMKELQDLGNNKHGLDTEIAAFKKLLEGAEARSNSNDGDNDDTN